MACRSGLIGSAAASALLVIRQLALPMTLIAAIAQSQSAYAATIVEDVDIPSPQTPKLSAYLGTAFPEFNPTLGTLNSLTFDIAGTYSQNAGGSTVSFAGRTPNASFTFALTSPNAFEVFPFSSGSFSYTDTDTFDAFAFVGTGSAQIGDFLNGGADLTVSSSSTVTYNYTSAVAVPEPASIALLGAGLLGVAGLYRRRSRG